MPNYVREIEGGNSFKAFDSVYSFREPVVIRRLITDWPAVKAGLKSDREMVDYLLQFYSDKTVVCYFAETDKKGRFFYTDDLKRLDFDSSRMPLNNVLNKLLESKNNPSSGTFYVGSTTVDVCLPGFRQQNDLELSGLDPLVSIWIGNQSKVAAHFDAPDNIACCVAGKRRFQLLPIEQVENIYVGPVDFTPSGQAISMVDFSNPDYEKFPLFKRAENSILIADLNPGDAIYIPSMWWHQVESLEDFNILVNYWWRDVARYVDPGLNALVYSMLCIRDLPEHEKAAWKALFDYYIFGNQKAKYDHIPEAARGFLAPMDEKLARKTRAWLINKLNR